MAFKDDEPVQLICLPKLGNPKYHCRMEALQKAIEDVPISGNAVYHLRYTLREICQYCTKQNRR